MHARTKIGFDRTIASEWLDAAAAIAARNDPDNIARRAIWDFLEGIETGDIHGSNRQKTSTVLRRIWLDLSPPLKPLRSAAISLLSLTPPEQRIAIHWAMICGTHPFFVDVASHVGSLFKLHGQIETPQIKRRMTDTWGDRSTLERAVQHVLRSMAQWGVIEAIRKGSSLRPAQQEPVSSEVAKILLASILISRGRGMAFAQLINHASLFPFAIRLTARDLAGSGLFRLHRQGDQTDFVEMA